MSEKNERKPDLPASMLIKKMFGKRSGEPRLNPVQKRRGAFKNFSENHRTTNAGKVPERV
ncbi:unnamed protein product [Klebsiella oxytoca]|nr:unnamed protein product [Klebsiella oxytoca]